MALSKEEKAALRKKNLKKLYDKQYYKNNREKIIEKAKEYHEANKEIIAKRGQIYYINNKKQKKQKSKQHYEKNKEKINIASKKWIKNNPKGWKKIMILPQPKGRGIKA